MADLPIPLQAAVLVFAGLGIAAVLLWHGIGKRRQHEYRERFVAEPREPDERFLAAIGSDLSPEGREAALVVRAVLAEHGEVPLETVHAEHRLYHDLGALPGFDGLDVVELVMALEERLDIEISDEQTWRIFGGDPTVGEVASGVAALRRAGR